jgi:GNAT superfamily N-acetyltransferase
MRLRAVASPSGRTHDVEPLRLDWAPIRRFFVELIRRQENAAGTLLETLKRHKGKFPRSILIGPSSLAWARGTIAPLAVIPQHQRNGIGSRLVQAGLEECRRAGVAAVFVVGHPS